MPVTLLRTGGFAGVRESVHIDPAGAWTSETKSGGKKTGQLSPAQVKQLQAFAADPHVAVEVAAPTPDQPCADGFTYSVTVDRAEIRFSDCPHSSEPRIAKAIVGLVQGAVPGW